MDSFAVVDLETTGLGRNDRVVEIAVVLLDPVSLEVTDEFDSLVNPLRDVGPTRIHGISASMVGAAPLFEELADHVAALINNSILVAHNLPFDSRFLGQEFQRTQIDLDLGHGLCTLRLTRQKLELACASLGIQLENSHRALADARATAELLRRLKSSGLSLEGSAVHVNEQPTTRFTRTLRREHVSDQRLDTRIPPVRWALPGGGDAELSYLNMLDRYLDDGKLTAQETEALHDLAQLYGITDDVNLLHEKYLQAISEAAWRDGVLTDAEVAHLQSTASALGVPLHLQTDHDDNTSTPIDLDSKDALRVCFTGEALVEGRVWPRADLHALALRNGFIPVDSVTKKSCDLLVAADVGTGSGKAKKAREWGIQVLSVEEFVRKLT